jgi:hypothetical protein
MNAWCKAFATAGEAFSHQRTVANPKEETTMTAYKQQQRDLALIALTTIAEMYIQSPLARKLDSDDQRIFDGLVNTWAIGLESYTSDEVEAGIKAVIESGDVFAPSLPEFRALCRPKRLHASHRPLTATEAAHEAQCLLPPVQPAGDSLAAMRARELQRIGMQRQPGECKHDHTMRCREWLKSSALGRLVVGRNAA